MPLPTRLFLGLAAAAAVLFLVDAALALAADLLLVVAALVDHRLAGAAGGPAVERSAPARVAHGTTVGVRLRVSNPSTRPVRVRVTDDLPAALVRLGPDEREVRVPAGEAAVLDYEVRAVARGEAAMGDVHLRVLGPLGLAWREARHGRRDPMRVVPGVLEMRRARLLGIRQRMRRAGLRNVRQRGEGRAFESLRPYVRGDDPRAIDWKATARHEDLTVREYQAERSQNVILAVDAGRLMLESLGERERLDHALSAALQLGDVAAVHGDHVGALLFADRIQGVLPPRRGSTARIAETLALVEPRLVEPDYPLAFATLSRLVRRRSLVVLFTDVIDPEASSALVAQATRAAVRHLVMAVALRNPELVARADEPVTTEAGAYGRAAAEELLQARAVALATMQRSGVLVVDVEPGAVVAEVLSRYLEAKYRGRF